MRTLFYGTVRGVMGTLPLPYKGITMMIRNIIFLSCIVVGGCQAGDMAAFLKQMGGPAGQGSQKSPFPINGDATLGPEFTHAQLALACAQGDKETLEHFLENYPDLLALPYEDNYPLALAAFSYLRGEQVREVNPSIEGFKLLAEQETLKKNFTINAGFGIMAFDEWLLHEATYPEDAGKQQRLIDLQKILVSNLSQERRSSLDAALARKTHKKKKLATYQVAKSNKRNKAIAFVVGLVGVAGLYWLYTAKSKKTVANAVA